jgi:hypothetical protein
MYGARVFDHYPKYNKLISARAGLFIKEEHAEEHKSPNISSRNFIIPVDAMFSLVQGKSRGSARNA